MPWAGNSLWRGVLPEFPPCSRVSYFVSAEDWAGNEGISEAIAFTEPGECGGNPADLDGDGVVDGVDLGTLLSSWGQKGGSADLDGSGLVDGADLAALLNAWS